LKINAGFDEAFVKSDASFFERFFAPEYIFSNNFGVLFSRAENLEFLRNFSTDPPYKILAQKSDNVKVRVFANAALLTSDWTGRALAIGDPNAKPQTDAGCDIGFYENRGGKWLVVAEHLSEKNHDTKLMAQKVLQASPSYNQLMKRPKSTRSYADSEKSGDIGALGLLLADEYSYTSRDGKIFTKAEGLESYKINQIKIESAEILEQNVRVISNYTADEMGKIRYLGTNAGKPFNISKRYTTTWIWRYFRWQIAADQTSAVKPQS